MKMYDKKDLRYQNGYLVKGEEIVSVDNEVVDLFNQIDIDIQHTRFNRARKTKSDMISEIFDHDFTPKSEYAKPVIDLETPSLEAKTKETMEILRELDGLEAKDKINNRLDGLRPVTRFVLDDFIVETEQPTQHRFDLPTLGDPLKLSIDDIIELVVEIYDPEAQVERHG